MKQSSVPAEARTSCWIVAGKGVGKVLCWGQTCGAGVGGSLGVGHESGPVGTRGDARDACVPSLPLNVYLNCSIKKMPVLLRPKCINLTSACNLLEQFRTIRDISSDLHQAE